MIDHSPDARLEIAPHLDVYRSGQQIFLLGGEKTFVLRNEVEQAAISALIVSHRFSDAIARLGTMHTTCAIGSAIRRLRRAGVLVEASGLTRASRSYWSGFASVALHEVEEALARSRVLIEGTCAAATDDLDSALAETGLLSTPTSSTATLALLVVGSTIGRSLETVVSGWEERALPWLPIHMSASEWMVGPIHPQGELDTWRKTVSLIHRRYPFHYLLNAREDDPACLQRREYPRNIARTIFGLVAFEIAKAIADRARSRLYDSVMRIDIRDGSISWHRVQRARQRASATNVTTLQIETSGGWRSTPVLHTLERLRELVDPQVGLVSRLLRVGPSEADWLEVRAAAYRQVAAPATLELLKQHTGYCFGKGTSAAEAEASAIAEAVERNSLSFRGDEVRRRAAFNEFGPDEALPPAALTLASARQLSGNGPWWPGPRPTAFDPDVAIDWSPARSLLSDKTVWLPTEAIYFDTPVDHPSYCVADSNGVAAGNTWEEAVIQGFLELIERDAHAIWWYNRLQRPRIAIDANADARLCYLARCHEKLDRTLWFLDITHDARIPVVVAVSERKDRSGFLLYAVGSHFSPDLAALRALNELHQRLALLLDPRHAPNLPVDTRQWLQRNRLEDYPQLRSTIDTIGLKDIASGPPTSALSPPACVTVTKDLGLDLLTVDITRDELAFPVVRVVVPGLRHYWPRFGPGRLYDVPVALGWRQSRMPEEKLAPPPPVF